jgi:hypothetical protein
LSRTSDARSLTAAEKLALATRVWRSLALVRLQVHRKPLPDVVRSLGRGRAPRRYPPTRLSRAVDRATRVGGGDPTCLVRALVLYDLLRAQGDKPQLVIGLPEHARDHEAHAWVELDGADVGPPPGRGRHSALARFD